MEVSHCPHAPLGHPGAQKGTRGATLGPAELPLTLALPREVLCATARVAGGQSMQ